MDRLARYTRYAGLHMQATRKTCADRVSFNGQEICGRVAFEAWEGRRDGFWEGFMGRMQSRCKG